MEYRVDDQELETPVFLSFVNKIWPGNYDVDKTRAALSKTLNITAYDGQVACVSLQMVIILERLQNCWFFPSINDRE